MLLVLAIFATWVEAQLPFKVHAVGCDRELVRLNVLPIGHHVDFPAEVGDSPGKVMVNIILLVWNVQIEKS